MKTCECCGQEIPPKLSIDEYNARAKPRLAIMDQLAKKIDFSSMTWEHTPEGQRYERLQREQNQDECDAGL